MNSVAKIIVPSN